MNQEQVFKNHLRAAGERITAPRIGIFRVLLRQGPISMPLLIAKANEDGIDQVTTYRTIDLLRKLGHVQEVGLGKKRLLELSDHYQAHHHHAVCVSCGKLYDFDSKAIEDELKRVGEQLGLTVYAHQVEVSGVCGRCSKAGRTV